MSNPILLSILAAGVVVPVLGAAEAAPPGAPAEALTLEAAVRAALERAPEVALARSGAERAGAAVGETRSLNRPQIVSGTGLAYNNGYPLSLEGSAPSLFQVAVSQEIGRASCRERVYGLV